MQPLIKKNFKFGNRNLTIQSGLVAKQSTSSIVIDVDGTTILVTIVYKKTKEEMRDFLPLTVNYQERFYAAGKIPGGFFKREGRATEKEVLTSRLIDRSIRTLFDQNITDDIQLVCTAISINPDVDPDIVAIIGASCALNISGINFNGPIAACRVGMVDDKFIINPTQKEMEKSNIDLVVSGTDSAVIMVESEINDIHEDIVLEAVWQGHLEITKTISIINEFKEEFVKKSELKEKNEFSTESQSSVDDYINVKREINKFISSKLADIYRISEKTERTKEIDILKDLTIEKFIPNINEKNDVLNKIVLTEFKNAQKKLVREKILSGETRIDGRDTRTIRPINIETGFLERTHGSALFTRGETQALVVTTLGTDKDMQFLDDLICEKKDRFMLHYNFPPYCTGEVGPIGIAPKRREIGHGKLAKRAIAAVLPTQQDFQYTIRIVSEITESNGSSSMASVCGGILSLMDAGVPIKKPVAGIAMGLIKDETRFAVLSDILGDEDFFGDMDFKVAGTEDGLTALQMDIKISGITKFIMKKALTQAREGINHILSKMKENMSTPNKNISEFAPVILLKKIPTMKIKDVIGKGGSTIKSLTIAQGSNIDISDDGSISISAISKKASEDIWEKIREIIGDNVQIGEIVEGKVIKIIDSGAFIHLPKKNRDGFLHISQISGSHIKNINKAISLNQIINVKIVNIDDNGRIRLSIKEIN